MRVVSHLLERIETYDVHTTNLLDDWPIYALYMFLLVGLLASSLIDFEFFIIPPEIPWATAVIAFAVHGTFDHMHMPGALNLVSEGRVSASAAVAAGGAIGLLLSIVLWMIGLIPTSFPKGEPVEELDQEEFEKEKAKAREDGRELDMEPPPTYTRAQVRAEIRKEMLFLMPAVAIGLLWLCLTMYVPAIDHWWQGVAGQRWMSALLGSMLGAMVGGLVVWLARFSARWHWVAWRWVLATYT